MRPLAAIIVMAWLPAHAGIIITEGKIAEEQEPAKDAAKNAASSKRRPVTTEKQVDEGEGDDAAPTCVRSTKTASFKSTVVSMTCRLKRSAI